MSQGGTEKPDSGGRIPPARTPPTAKPSSGSTRSTAQPPSGGTVPTGVSRRPAAKSGSQPQLQLGSYRIVERIGAGGMGTVYRAIHTELDREVALKVLPLEMNSNPTMVARFKQEAKSVAQLQHENIVQIYDVKEEKGRIFLALEFVRGQDLSDLITAKKHLTIKQSINILKQAARALDHAFQKGIVHRDIKPSNFLITKEGKLKLCDMGLALRADAGDEAKVTRDGTTVGTVDYMSPEQSRDSRLADTRSDIYSLGCTLYQMLTGRVPFEEGSIPEKLFKHNQEPVPDPLQFNSEIPSSVLYVLNRMLEKKPEDRYQSPRELLQDLDQLDLDEPKANAAIKTLAIGVEADETATEELVLQRPGGRSTLKAEAERAKTEKQRKLMIYGGVGTAAILLIAAALWFALRPPGKSSDLASNSPPNTTSGSASSGASTTGTSTTGSGTAPPLTAVSTVPVAPTGSTPGNDKVADENFPSSHGEREPANGETDRTKTETAPPTAPLSETPPRVEPVSAADREKIAQELFPPWPTVAIPGAPVKLARGVQEEKGGVFATFEAACRSAQSGSSKIDVEDSGPFFQRSFSVNKANLEIRPVYPERQQNPWRPVVVLDTTAKKGDSYFIQAKSSNLVIEGIDFVVNADDLKESIGLTPFAIFDIQGGDLVLKNCTFTVLGKHAVSVSIVKFRGLRDADPSRQPERLARLTLEGCYGRGEPLAAVTLASGLADVKIIDSLFVGGQMGTLIELLPPDEPTARPERTLRFVRSTFATRGDFLFMDGSSGGDVPTHFKLMDSIIACSSPSGARKLIRLKSWPEQQGVFAKATWDDRSSLYTGWGENLVYSIPPGKLVAKSPDAWLQIWGLQPADSRVRHDPWPSQDLGDLGMVVTAEFAQGDIAGGIQSRWGAATIGCDLNQLPNMSPMLYERSFGRVTSEGLAPLSRLIPSMTLNGQKNPSLAPWKSEQSRRRAAPPGTLVPGDELDPVLELTFDANSAGDLGKFIMSQPELPDTTIIEVTGTGVSKMTPVRLAGKKSLVIYVKQSAGQSPLIFVPTDSGTPAEALIEVRYGDLIIEGAVFSWPTGGGGGLPRRFIKVEQGNLTLSGCRMFGPLVGETGFEAIEFNGGTQKSKPPAAPSTPVHFDFHPAPHPRVNVCQLVDCYVGADARCIRFIGSEGVLSITNCIALSAGTIASFDELDRAEPQKFEKDVIIEQSTLAASRNFFEVGDWTAPVFPSRPISFSTRDNLFCDPFELVSGTSAKARGNVLLRYGGRTLQQGLIAWHSEYDAFSNDMHAYMQRKDSSTNPRQEFDQQWQPVWGRVHIKNEIVDGKKIDKIRLAGKPTASASLKLKDFERDKKLSDLALQDQCEATKKASHGGRVGADVKKLGL